MYRLKVEHAGGGPRIPQPTVVDWITYFLKKSYPHWVVVGPPNGKMLKSNRTRLASISWMIILRKILFIFSNSYSLNSLPLSSKPPKQNNINE